MSSLQSLKTALIAWLILSSFAVVILVIVVVLTIFVLVEVAVIWGMVLHGGPVCHLAYASAWRSSSFVGVLTELVITCVYALWTAAFCKYVIGFVLLFFFLGCFTLSKIVDHDVDKEVVDWCMLAGVVGELQVLIIEEVVHVVEVSGATALIKS